MENITLNALHDQAKQAIRERRFSDAQRVLKQATDLDKRNVTTWWLYTYALSGEPQKQQQALKYAKQLAPNDPRVVKREGELASQAIAQPSIPAPSVRQPSVASASKQSNAAAGRTRLPLLLLAGVGAIVVFIIIGVLFVKGISNSSSPTTAQNSISSAITFVPTTMSPASGSASSASSQAPAVPEPTIVPTLTPVSGANSGGNDPLVSTATALAQQMTATGQSLLNVAQGQTQVAQLTQTATQQGALGATVAAQQTSVAVMNTLPGTLWFSATDANKVINSKFRFLPIDGQLTPDKQHITYSKGYGSDLFLTNLDGSGKQVILSGSVHLGGLLWAPDTKHFALVDGDARTSNVVRLYVAGIDGAAPKVLTPNTMKVDLVAWAPDGQHIAFSAITVLTNGTSQYGVYLIAIDGNSPIQTVVAPAKFFPPYSPITALEWLPSGQQILYCEEHPNNNGLVDYYAIQTVNSNGANPHMVVKMPQSFVQGCNPELSPNGKWVSITDQSHDFYLLSIDTGVLNKITALSSTNTIWSPDGKYLAGFTFKTNGNNQVSWTDPETGIVSSASVNSDWLSQRVIWSPDSKSMLTCGAAGSQTGQVILIPIAANSTPVTLIDNPVCPVYWLP